MANKFSKAKQNAFEINYNYYDLYYNFGPPLLIVSKVF